MLKDVIFFQDAILLALVSRQLGLVALSNQVPLSLVLKESSVFKPQHLLFPSCFLLIHLLHKSLFVFDNQALLLVGEKLTLLNLLNSYVSLLLL